jgi:iron transport multicopper oxidase
MQTIIEVDGVNVVPLVVDSIQIFAGQRYSFVLEANQTVDNYWIRAQPNIGTTTFDGGLNSAILRYDGANATADPTTTSNLTNLMLETDLHPLANPGAPGQPEVGGVDVALNLDIVFTFSNLTFTINDAQFIPPTVPVILQILSGARTAQDLLPLGSVYTLPPNQVVELSIPGGAPGAPVSNESPLFVNSSDEFIQLHQHPFHLHGVCSAFQFL